MRFFLFILLFFFVGCQQHITKKPNISQAKLQKISWDNLIGFEDDNLTFALKVFQKDCKAPKIQPYLKEVCKKSFSVKSAKAFFKNNFEPYRLLDKNNNQNGLITGYYEPILNGSLVKTNIFKYPIYKTPKDLVVVKLSSIYPELKKYRLRGKIVNNILVPYNTREELQKNKKILEPLVYLDNKIDGFFLEIQGSGKIKLQNGKIINVAYAQQNGHKYYAIGKKLLQTKKIKRKDLSLKSIKQWCKTNPSKVDKLLNLNKSVVFFKLSKKSATGSLGVQLVAKRNIAVDTRFIPLGSLVFLNTINPQTQKSLNILTVAADTGGAIKGSIRADYFWGNTKEAKENASKMAQKGKLTILIPLKNNNNNNNKIQWINDTTEYIKVKEKI